MWGRKRGRGPAPGRHLPSEARNTAATSASAIDTRRGETRVLAGFGAKPETAAGPLAGDAHGPTRRRDSHHPCGSDRPVRASVGYDGAVFGMAADAAAITHGHPSCFLSAGHFAVTIAALLRGGHLPAAVDAADTQLRAQKHYAEITEAIVAARVLAASGKPPPEQLETLGGGWVAEEALAIAICCALTARDFADGVLLGVNHSGDSDSTAATTGSLLGA